MDCSHASTHQGPRSLASPSASASTSTSSSCLHFLHDSKAAAFAPAQQHSLHTIMRPMQATQAAQATQPIHVAELIDRLKLLGHLELTVEDTDRGDGDAAGSAQHQAVTITNTTTNDSRTFLLPLQHGQLQQQQTGRHGGLPLRCDLGEIGRVCDDVDAIVNGPGGRKPIGEEDAGVCGATAIITDDDCSTSSTTAASSISTITACDSLVVESVSAEDGIDGNDDGPTTATMTATMTHYSDEDHCESQAQKNAEAAQSSISGSTSAAAVIEKRVRFCTCDVIPSCNDGENDISSKDSNKRTPSNDHKCCAIREPACIPTLSRKEYTWAEREATWHSLKELLLFKSQADSDWNDVRKGRKPMERGLEHRVKLIVKDDDDDDNDGDNDGNSDEANGSTSREDDLASCRRNKLILRHRKKQRAAARNAVLDAQDGFERMRPLVSNFPEEEDDMHHDVSAATDCNEERVAAAYCEHTYSSQTLAAIIGLLDQKVANEIYQEDAHVSEMVGDDASISLNTSSSSTVKNKNERYVHSPRRRRAMLKMTLKCQKHRYILPGM
mmetsp:Transcript_3967/g.11172  ORF Transcript_3967/g.11172 Transcript_3967/m.11172 type:complete len:555 (-) Transcript_3967:93-1757(-)